MDHLLSHLTNININILPIIIIPVAGLCSLVFYNRLGALNTIVRALQNEAKGIKNNPNLTSEQKTEYTEDLQNDHDKIVSRSNIVRKAIQFLLTGIIAFNLSAISIMLSIVFPTFTMVTLILWLLGATLYCVGLIIGLLEVRAHSFELVTIKGVLVDN